MASHAVVLKGDYVQKEGKASGTIKPGMLIEFGGANQLQAHATANGKARKAFALENDLIGGGLDDNYLVDQNVKYGVMQRGAEVNALLANSNNASVGTALCSNGDGALRVSSASGGNDDEEIVGYAMVALNNTSGSAARLRIEIA